RTRRGAGGRRIELPLLRHQQLDKIHPRPLHARKQRKVLRGERPCVGHRNHADRVHPFTAPPVNPPTSRRCANRNSSVAGSAINLPPAVSGPQWISFSPMNNGSATVTVRTLRPASISANRYSFHDAMNR